MEEIAEMVTSKADRTTTWAAPTATLRRLITSTFTEILPHEKKAKAIIKKIVQRFLPMIHEVRKNSVFIWIRVSSSRSCFTLCDLRRDLVVGRHFVQSFLPNGQTRTDARNFHAAKIKSPVLSRRGKVGICEKVTAPLSW